MIAVTAHWFGTLAWLTVCAVMAGVVQLLTGQRQ